MSLNGTPTLAEDIEIEMLIIASLATLKRSSKKCVTNEVFDLVESSLGINIITHITHETIINHFKIGLNFMQLNYEQWQKGNIYLYLKKNKKIYT